ncbi:Checkpoint protein hus1 [Sorochytrium milnesiophthora]
MAQAVDKIAKTCVLRFTEKKVYFIVKDAAGGMQVHCHIDNDSVVEDLLIQSLSNNEIWMQVQSEWLARAFRSAVQSHDIKIKLTKKDDQGLLSLSIMTESRTGRNVAVQQDVPILVLKKLQIAELREPAVPPPDVYILLPPLVTLRTLAERMRTIAHHVVLSANFCGSLVLKCETDAVTIETVFTDLVHPEMESSQDQPQSQDDKERYFDVRVDIRDFVKFVYSHHVNPSNVVCCIHEAVCAVFYVYVGSPAEIEKEEGAVLTYYLPAKHL